MTVDRRKNFEVNHVKRSVIYQLSHTRLTPLTGTPCSRPPTLPIGLLWGMRCLPYGVKAFLMVPQSLLPPQAVFKKGRQ